MRALPFWGDHTHHLFYEVLPRTAAIGSRCPVCRMHVDAAGWHGHRPRSNWSSAQCDLPTAALQGRDRGRCAVQCSSSDTSAGQHLRVSVLGHSAASGAAAEGR